MQDNIYVIFYSICLYITWFPVLLFAIQIKKTGAFSWGLPLFIILILNLLAEHFCVFIGFKYQNCNPIYRIYSMFYYISIFWMFSKMMESTKIKKFLYIVIFLNVPASLLSFFYWEGYLTAEFFPLAINNFIIIILSIFYWIYQLKKSSLNDEQKAFNWINAAFITLHASTIMISLTQRSFRLKEMLHIDILLYSVQQISTILFNLIIIVFLFLLIIKRTQNKSESENANI